MEFYRHAISLSYSRNPTRGSGQGHALTRLELMIQQEMIVDDHQSQTLVIDQEERESKRDEAITMRNSRDSQEGRSSNRSINWKVLYFLVSTLFHLRFVRLTLSILFIGICVLFIRIGIQYFSSRSRHRKKIAITMSSLNDPSL
jgi:hypothetical protein